MFVCAKNSEDGHCHRYCDGCGKEINVGTLLIVNDYAEFFICKDECLPKLRELLRYADKNSSDYTYLYE